MMKKEAGGDQDAAVLIKLSGITNYCPRSCEASQTQR